MEANIHALETCVTLLRDPSHSLKIVQPFDDKHFIDFCCSFGSTCVCIFFLLSGTGSAARYFTVLRFQIWMRTRQVFLTYNVRFSILSHQSSGEALSCKILLLPFIFWNKFSLSFSYMFCWSLSESLHIRLFLFFYIFFVHFIRV